MPMQHDAFVEKAADRHYEPVSIQGRRLARGRDVVEVLHAVSESVLDRLKAVQQQKAELSHAQVTDVLQLFGQPRVDVVQLDIKWRCGWLHGSRSGFFPIPTVAAQPLQHE